MNILTFLIDWYLGAGELVLVTVASILGVAAFAAGTIVIIAVVGVMSEGVDRLFRLLFRQLKKLIPCNQKG